MKYLPALIDMVEYVYVRAEKGCERMRESTPSPRYFYTCSSVVDCIPDVHERGLPMKRRRTQSILSQPTDKRIGRYRYNQVLENMAIGVTNAATGRQ